jgi:hypothetical protein
MQSISGRFEVRMQALPDIGAETGAQHHRLDKRYHGTLDATGIGEMLSHRTGNAASAGYVAIERVVGMLEGRKGSFMLQHAGLMARGAQQLDLQVIPDSADGELTGLIGRMRIRIEGGQHYYDFDYELQAPEAAAP